MIVLQAKCDMLTNSSRNITIRSRSTSLRSCSDQCFPLYFMTFPALAKTRTRTSGEFFLIFFASSAIFAYSAVSEHARSLRHDHGIV
jgi:hypothetical protein